MPKTSGKILKIQQTKNTILQFILRDCDYQDIPKNVTILKNTIQKIIHTCTILWLKKTKVIRQTIWPIYFKKCQRWSITGHQSRLWLHPAWYAPSTTLWDYMFDNTFLGLNINKGILAITVMNTKTLCIKKRWTRSPWLHGSIT